MTTKVYEGRYQFDPLSAAIVTVNGRPLKHVAKHSPTGLSWGYGGSGPADTALSILTDMFGGNKELAEVFYFEFTWEFVTSWGNEWKITSEEINEWLKVRTGRSAQELINKYLELDEEERLELRCLRRLPE